MKSIIRGISLLQLNLGFVIALLFSFSNNLFSQDLDVNQTLSYINNKFNEFPEENGYGINRYEISLTPQGELYIVNKFYTRTISGIASDPSITISKIAVDKIDIESSFKRVSSLNCIEIYPTINGSYYEEKVGNSAATSLKRTIPALASYSRNRIWINIGDVSKLQSINNAFAQLCTLVISDPIKYGINSGNVDPFESTPKPKESKILSDGFSNTIKILKSKNGLIEVPIVLNDVLRINFIFDSGASEVSLSPDVALTLLRTGTISENDWLLDQVYTFADGSKAKSKRFLIKKLIIGNQTLTNIEASISKSIEAPMLIGQNVMQKLGSVTIDYNNMLLIIKSK